MGAQVNAEIIAVGTEILLGEITDTNSVYIARALRGIGVNVYFMTSVGDNEARIAHAVEIALNRSQVVITCGGLGPTVDDMTRQGVARACGRQLAYHEDLLQAIEARFKSFGVRMSENNRRQAYLPEGAEALTNPVGTAPGFVLEHEGKLIFSVPGVPREMKYLFENEVLPRLRTRYGLSIIKARILKTAGIGESMLDEAIGQALLEGSNPTVGLAAHSGQVDVRITAKADTEADADAMIAAAEAELRARIGAYIFGADDDTLEGALAAALDARGAQLAVVEAGVPGSINRRMAERGKRPDLIAVYHRLSRPEEVAAAALAIAAPASLRELAEAAARALASEEGTRVGIAVIADPDRADDRADVDVGSAFAVCVGGRVRSRAYGFGGSSEAAQQWSGTWAMSMAWQMLKDDAQS